MKYRSTFIVGTRMRERLDAFVRGEADPFPGSSGSEDVEKMVGALFGDHPNPYSDVMMQTKARTRRMNEYPIVAPVAAALVELFELRDARVENLKGAS